MDGYPHFYIKEFHNVPSYIRETLTAILKLNDAELLEVVAQGICHYFTYNKTTNDVEFKEEVQKQTIVPGYNVHFDSAMKLHDQDFYFLNDRMFHMKNGSLIDIGDYITPCSSEAEQETGLFLRSPTSNL